MSSYNNFLMELFKSPRTFLSGQELNERLQREFGVTPTNSRKIVQRAVLGGYIKSSDPISFGKGQYIYFSKNSILDKSAVMRISQKYRPAIFRLLSLLDLCDGVISYFEGLKVTGCPLDNTKTKKNTLDEILDALGELNLVETVMDQTVKYIVSADIHKESAPRIKKHLAKMSLDCSFLGDIKNWLISHNLIDNKNVLYRNKAQPAVGFPHNNYVWDAFAYTKTTGFNTTHSKNSVSDDKSSLVVLDVVIHREYTEIDLQGFYERVQGVLCSTKTGTRKVVPIVIIQKISDAAYGKIKELGFITFNLGSIYGEKIYDIIQQLNIIKLVEIGASIEDITSNISNVLSSIKESGQESNLQNLKGDLFESLMYPLMKSLYPQGAIKQGKVLKQDKQSVQDSSKKPKAFEFDAIINDYGFEETIVIEMKGYKSTAVIELGPYTKYGTVKYFFNNTFPVAKENLSKDKTFQSAIKACYITTAKFSEDALKTLEQLNRGNLKPSQMDVYYDGEKLISLLKSRGLNDVVKVLDKHYMNA